jgi:hypothetical protein
MNSFLSLFLSLSSGVEMMRQLIKANRTVLNIIRITVIAAWD